MEFNIIYGKVQSGKSTYIYNKIEELINLKLKGKKEFDKIYIITPEQFSFSTEKKLLDRLDGATLDSEVLSFSRMADRLVFKGDALSKSAKAMIIYQIMVNNKDKLKLLDKTTENIEIILNAIDEFEKHGIRPKDLENEIEKLDNVVLIDKLNDLNLIFSLFVKKLSDVYITSQDKLRHLANLDLSCFSNSYIFIDEFNGFTTIEMALIKNLIINSKMVTISASVDELKVWNSPDIDLYYDNKQNLNRLITYLAENGIEKVNYLKTNFQSQTQSQIEHLKKCLGANSYEKYEGEKSGVKIVSCQNKIEEVQYVARSIVKNIRQNNLRYRDIAIAIENLEDYLAIIKSVFLKYEIPVFIDDKKQLNQNNITQYVLYVLEILITNFSSTAILNFLKINFENDELYYSKICILENYVKKWNLNYNGWKKEIQNKYESEDILNIVNEIRQKYIVPLVELKENIKGKKSVSNIIENIYLYLEKIEFEKRIKISIISYEQKGYIELANTYKKSYEITLKLFDEVYNLFKDDKMSLEDIYNILKIGFTNSKFATLPSTLDQVVVGDIRRSKRDNIKALYILGANDGTLPKVMASEGFLNDEDRKVLKSDNLQIGKGTIENIYESNFNIYRAIITSKEKLYLTYLTQTEDGKPNNCAQIVNKVKILLDIKEEVFKDKILDNFDINKKISYENLIRYISVLGNKLEKENEALNKELKNLKDLNSKKVVLDEYNQNLKNINKKIDEIIYITYKILEQEKVLSKSNMEISSIFFENYAFNLTKQTVENLYNSNILQMSISKLEKYVSCPFSYFLTYNLKLKPNETLKPQNYNYGSLMHSVVEQFFDNVKVLTQNEDFQNEKEYLQNLTDDNLKEIVEMIVDQKLKDEKNFVFNLEKKSNVVSKRIKSILFNSIKYIIYGLLNSDFYIDSQETEFGSGKKYKPIRIDMEDKTLELVGKIDRVDKSVNDKNYVRIVDYKTYSHDLSLSEIYFGKALQLFTYLDAICNQDESLSCGLLYFKLDEKQTNTKEEQSMNYRMSGYVLNDLDVLLMQDNHLLENKKSDIVPASVTSKGNIKKTNSLLSEDDFETIKKYVPKKIKNIAKDILDGKIDIAPCKMQNSSSCEFCKFADICNFDSQMRGNNYLYIPRLSNDSVIFKMKGLLDDNN